MAGRAGSGKGQASPIRRRRVLFISGFDPRGPRHYHQLWREEAEKAGSVTLGPRRARGEAVVEWTMRAGEVETRFDFLRWDDVARSLWPKPGWGFVRDMLRTVWRGLRIGYFRRVARVRPVYLLTILQPVALVLAAMLGLMALAAGLAAWPLALAGLSPLWAAALAPLGLLALPLVLRAMEKGTVLWRAELNRYIGDFIFGEDLLMQARIDRFAALITEAVAGGDEDEILVVGHSVGTVVAVAALGRALQSRPDAFAGRSGIGLVTLGAMTPALAVEPRADWFRAAVAAIALHPTINWLDCSAPYDVFSFERVDPLAAAGQGRAAGTRLNPVLVTPRYHTLYEPAAYRTLRRDPARMHTQYLLTTPKAGRCDFFALVVGAEALNHRFPEFDKRQRR